MALKSYKPTTPGQRGLVLIDRSELWKGRPVKNLTEGLTKKGGRNNTGRITARRRGGGAKRLYRIVDFKRTKMDVPATVERIEYDPNRTAFIALVRYNDGEQAYILAPQRLAVGDTVLSASKADIKPGNAMPFSGMPIGTIVHNIELKPGKGGQIARAAGTYAQFVGRDGGYAQIRLSRANFASCARNAWPPSALSRTPTIPTRTSARPGASATWASVRASVVSS
jgi:large subunit ribosomal protein L2